MTPTSILFTITDWTRNQCSDFGYTDFIRWQEKIPWLKKATTEIPKFIEFYAFLNFTIAHILAKRSLTRLITRISFDKMESTKGKLQIRPTHLWCLWVFLGIYGVSHANLWCF